MAIEQVLFKNRLFFKFEKKNKFANAPKFVFPTQIAFLIFTLFLFEFHLNILRFRNERKLQSDEILILNFIPVVESYVL